MNISETVPTTLYLARHAQTELNHLGLRCGGDLDIPLTETGRDQAIDLGMHIQQLNLDIDLIITSPLLRTRKTSELVADLIGNPQIVEAPLLKERSLGGWNKQSIAETEALLKNHQTPPGGESEYAFRARIHQALEWMMPYLNEHRVLVVGSKGVARMLHSLLGGEGRFVMGNGELVRFESSQSGAGSAQLQVHKLLL